MGYFNITPKSKAIEDAPSQQNNSSNAGYFKVEKGVHMDVPAGHMPLGKMPTPVAKGGNPMAGTNPFRKIKR
jgi:hypothetical protein